MARSRDSESFLKRIARAAVLLSAMFVVTRLDAAPVGIGVGVGSLGVGASVSLGVHEYANVRVGVNRLTYDFNLTVDEVDYDSELTLKSMAAILDWHPWASSFRLSVGLVSSSNALSGTASPSADTIEFNGTVFSLEDAGEVAYDVDFRPNTGYVGFGWGNAVRGTGLMFFSDFGVLLHGPPKVDVTVQNPQAAGLVQADIDAEVDEFEDEVAGLRYYPVVTLGLAYNL